MTLCYAIQVTLAGYKVFIPIFPTNSAVIKMNRRKVVIKPYKTQQKEDKGVRKRINLRI